MAMSSGHVTKNKRPKGGQGGAGRSKSQKGYFGMKVFKVRGRNKKPYKDLRKEGRQKQTKIGVA